MDRPTGSEPLETYVVERYWPGIDVARVAAITRRLEAAARAMTAEGTRIEHVGSILMPVDEVVFTLIAAGSESLVREVNARAGLPFDRVAVAIALIPQPVPSPGGVSS
jgi:hypothetical protein